jgi:hypothetical protein
MSSMKDFKPDQESATLSSHSPAFKAAQGGSGDGKNELGVSGVFLKPVGPAIVIQALNARRGVH